MRSDLDDRQVGAGAEESATGTTAVLESADACLALPNTPRRLQLDTVRAARREMARVYGLAARGQVSTRRASQLIFMLKVIASAIEVEQIEPMLRRLEALERELNNRVGR